MKRIKAAISAITAMSHTSAATAAASTLAMDNSKSALPTSGVPEAKEPQPQKTTAQVEVNPINCQFPPYYNIAVSEQQSVNCLNSPSVLNSVYPGPHIPIGLNNINSIELANIDSNGSKIEPRGLRACSQSPKTMPRAHASHRRQFHSEIHSASASPSLPSRSNHQKYSQEQINHSAPIASPQFTHGVRTSTAGIVSGTSDSASLKYGHESSETSSAGIGTLCRKEVLQQKVLLLLNLSLPEGCIPHLACSTAIRVDPNKLIWVHPREGFHAPGKNL